MSDYNDYMRTMTTIASELKDPRLEQLFYDTIRMNEQMVRAIVREELGNLDIKIKVEK